MHSCLRMGIARTSSSNQPDTRATQNAFTATVLTQRLGLLDPREPCLITSSRAANNDGTTWTFHEFVRTGSRRRDAMVQRLSAVNPNDRLAAFQKAAGYFRVARNLTEAYDVGRGLQRLARLRSFVPIRLG